LGVPAYRFSDVLLERARQLINQDVPRGVQQAREHSRRLVRAGPPLAAGLGYLGLVAVTGAGVGFGTSAAQGVLTAAVLLAAGICLSVGMSRHRLADALLTGWAGAWVGLGLAVVIGAAVGLLVGPGTGWPVFWSTWVTTIVAGTALVLQGYQTARLRHNRDHLCWSYARAVLR